MRPSTDELRAVDWDFPTSIPGVGTSLHWYPGTFPNAVPATLIEAFTKPGGTVFDPYSGIGTTGFEALRQGRNALLTDANPVATAVAGLSCALVFAQRVAPMYVAAVLDDLSSTVQQEETGKQSLLDIPVVEGNPLGGSATHLKALNEQARQLLSTCIPRQPHVDALAPWFHKRTFKDLLALYSVLTDESKSPLLRLAGAVMVSAVARSASSQTASWGHIADNCLPKDFSLKSVHYQCRIWLAKVARTMREVHVRNWTGGVPEQGVVLRHNWLYEPTRYLQERKGTVDLLITSPPYSSAIDYTLSQRLSHYLFGFSDDEVMNFVSEEIGARRKRFQPAPEEVWATQLASSLECQLSLMRDDGVVCVILPHKDAGRHLGAAAFETVMKQFNWRPMWSTSRSIRQSRTRQSWTSIQKEALLIFVGRGY